MGKDAQRPCGHRSRPLTYARAPRAGTSLRGPHHNEPQLPPRTTHSHTQLSQPAAPALLRMARLPPLARPARAGTSLRGPHHDEPRLSEARGAISTGRDEARRSSGLGEGPAPHSVGHIILNLNSHSPPLDVHRLDVHRDDSTFIGSTFVGSTFIGSTFIGTTRRSSARRSSARRSSARRSSGPLDVHRSKYGPR